MNCPYCNEKLEIPDNVVRNMETYHQSCRTVVGCCGKIVRLRPHMVFTASKADPSIKEDDWGMKSA
jgi:hypothetical protein